MLPENIKKLREKSGLTQKELAEKLFVTAQAVSRWENGNVEPSVAILTKMAEIFNVSLDEIINDAPKAKAVEAAPTEVRKKLVLAQPKPVLAVCTQCNKPIYNGNEIVRETSYDGVGCSHEYIICKACKEKNVTNQHNAAVAAGVKRRKNNFIWGGIITAAVLIIVLIATISAHCSAGVIVGASIAALCLFPFLGCCFLANNFVGDMFLSVASWGFVKMPGVIFSLDFDGLMFLVGAKILFFVLEIFFALCSIAFATVLGIICGLFTYPFALRKNFVSPESE